MLSLEGTGILRVKVLGPEERCNRARRATRREVKEDFVGNSGRRGEGCGVELDVVVAVAVVMGCGSFATAKDGEE